MLEFKFGSASNQGNGTSYWTLGPIYLSVAVVKHHQPRERNFILESWSDISICCCGQESPTKGTEIQTGILVRYIYLLLWSRITNQGNGNSYWTLGPIYLSVAVVKHHQPRERNFILDSWSDISICCCGQASPTKGTELPTGLLVRYIYLLLWSSITNQGNGNSNWNLGPIYLSVAVVKNHQPRERKFILDSWSDISICCCGQASPTKGTELPTGLLVRYIYLLLWSSITNQGNGNSYWNLGPIYLSVAVVKNHQPRERKFILDSWSDISSVAVVKHHQPRERKFILESWSDISICCCGQASPGQSKLELDRRSFRPLEVREFFAVDRKI